MARSYLTAINLNKNELQNAAVQNLGAAPSSPVKGQLYFNSTGGDNTLYWWDGTTWIPAKATGGAFPGYGSVPAETTFGITKNDGAATTVARSDHTHGSPTHDAAAHSTIPISALAQAAANVSMGAFRIVTLGTPQAAGDAATKLYVDNAIAGLSWKDSVLAATTGNITLSGAQTIDGVGVVGNDRVLVKNQTTASQNGIYLVNAGGWGRAFDADIATELAGAAVFVEQGTTQGDTAWNCTNDLTMVVDTTAVTWVQFAGGGAVTAGAGLTQTGNTLNVIAGDTTLTVAADDVRVNTSVIATVASLATYARKYTTATIGGATSQVVTHNLATQAVVVDVFRTATPWDTIDCDIERTTTNTATLRFAVAPATNEYTVVVVG